MFHKICKWCKDNLFITIIFGVFTLLILALVITVFIVKVKRENMSPEEKAAEAAQMHHDDVEDICNYLGDRTKKGRSSYRC